MTEKDTNLILVIIGLPARGKTFLSKKIEKYFLWLGYKASTFFTCKGTVTDSHEITPQDLFKFLNEEKGDIAILHSTNSNLTERKYLEKTLNSRLTRKPCIVYIESIITDNSMIERNILCYLDHTPHYKDWKKEEAIKDFKNKISIIEKEYESLSAERDGEDTPFIKLINYSNKIEAQNMRGGYLRSKLLGFLMNISMQENKLIYLVKHGESKNYKEHIFGTDSGLTEDGKVFSSNLRDFFDIEIKKVNKTIENEEESFSNCCIYCSSLRRTIETAEHLKDFGNIIPLKSLDDLDSGVRDGISLFEFKEKYKEEYQKRQQDKLNFRFFRGESYVDVIKRIENIIYELERYKYPVIIVGHQSVLRCIYGYLINSPPHQIPYLNLPANCVIKLRQDFYNWYETRFTIGETVTEKEIGLKLDKVLSFS